MKAVVHHSRGAWFPRIITLALLAGCAAHPRAESEQPAVSDSVHIGYGAVERDRVLGSVATVEGVSEEATHFRTFVEMLSRVVGVRVMERPGGEVSVRIRGGGSFRSNEEPLFILDGTALASTAGITGLDPNTIATITVLKDPGQTAIYGSRGANGVILIRTKGR